MPCFVSKLFIITITQHQNTKKNPHLASFFKLDVLELYTSSPGEYSVSRCTQHWIELQLRFSSPVYGVRTRVGIWSNVKRAYVHFLNFSEVSIVSSGTRKVELWFWVVHLLKFERVSKRISPCLTMLKSQCFQGFEGAFGSETRIEGFNWYTTTIWWCVKLLALA